MQDMTRHPWASGSLSPYTSFANPHLISTSRLAAALHRKCFCPRLRAGMRIWEETEEGAIPRMEQSSPLCSRISSTARPSCKSWLRPARSAKSCHTRPVSEHSPAPGELRHHPLDSGLLTEEGRGRHLLKKSKCQGRKFMARWRPISSQPKYSCALSVFAFFRLALVCLPPTLVCLLPSGRLLEGYHRTLYLLHMVNDQHEFVRNELFYGMRRQGYAA